MVRIAFLGTGLMGAPMVRNLAQSGATITVWNRTRAKADALVGPNVHAADTPADAVAGADFVISMLTDGPAVLAVADQLSVMPSAVWVDMSSTRPIDARAMEGRGWAFADAPVSGGVQGASDATLAIMVGAREDIFDRVAPVLRHMGRPTRVGPVGAGQLAKLANQAIVGVTIAAVAEATMLLEQGGADAEAVRAALRGGFADSTVLQQHGARMSTRDFTPGAPSSLQLKDLDNVLAEAQGLDLPVVSHVRDRYLRYINDLDGAALDHSGLFRELLDRNALG